MLQHKLEERSLIAGSVEELVLCQPSLVPSKASALAKIKWTTFLHLLMQKLPLLQLLWTALPVLPALLPLLLLLLLLPQLKRSEDFIPRMSLFLAIPMKRMPVLKGTTATFPLCSALPWVNAKCGPIVWKEEPTSGSILVVRAMRSATVKARNVPGSVTLPVTAA